MILTLSLFLKKVLESPEYSLKHLMPSYWKVTVTAQEDWLEGVVTDVGKGASLFVGENRWGGCLQAQVPLREQTHQGSAGLVVVSPWSLWCRDLNAG